MDAAAKKQSVQASRKAGATHQADIPGFETFVRQSEDLANVEKEGVQVSEKTVARAMKRMGLKSRTVKRYKATTNSNHHLPVAENVLDQTFTAEAPGKVWMTDITYITTDEGWLYLASVMDLYTRKIIGFHMDERMTKVLVITALD
nr:DDE-type integrase/transposase/recombinase [Paenibacillus humicola]